MENKEVKYPIGIQDFASIRKGGFLYVDKTELIYDIVDRGSYVFLCRPRRFGKSLLVSTLHYYLAGRKDLFTGLAIEELEKDWIQHPVLHFDLSRVKLFPPEDLRLALHYMLDKYDDIFGVKTSGRPGWRLNELIRKAHEITGQKVAVLIDEYDTPLLEVLDDPNELLAAHDTMAEFYSSLKSNDRFLKFVFLTGITNYIPMSMFSGFNNLYKISNHDRYAALCGFTEQELKDNFRQGIEELAEKKKRTPEETLAMLKDKYNGYHFTEALLDLYNPFSILNTFSKREIGDYWFESGTSTGLLRILKQYLGDFRRDLKWLEDNHHMDSSHFMKPIEDHAELIPLLYQSGYLTIKEYDREYRMCILDYPNAEVREGMLKALLPIYSTIDPDDAANAASRASTALREGDIDRAMGELQLLLEKKMFRRARPKFLDDMEIKEENYLKLFAMFFRMMHRQVYAEVKDSKDATDVTITTPEYVYVVELKEDTPPEVALEQLDKKGYAVPYLGGSRKVYKIGVNFSAKEHTLSEWKVMEG
jgi:hypothetical protein